MAWAENNYIETRFLGGMNCAVEPHTLDRDTGELPDVMNMMCRTQGLRTRKGWVRVCDLATGYSTLPTNAPSGIFYYEPALPADSEEGGEPEGGDEGDQPVIDPTDLIGDDSGGGGVQAADHAEGSRL